MRFGRALAFAVISFVLVGCLPRQDTASRQIIFSELDPSVTSYANMKFATLTIDSGFDFEIRPNDPAFDFGEDGVSYFRAFELPASAKPYRIVIKSYTFMTDCYPCKEAYFFPALTFLNASYEPVIISGPVPGKFFAGLSRARWEATYEVQSNVPVKYVIVHTSRRYMQAQMPDRQMAGTAVMPAPGVFVPMGGGNMSTKPIATGSLHIEIK